MGLFNKKNSELDERGQAIAKILDNEEDKNLFLEYWKNITKNSDLNAKEIDLIEQTILIIHNYSEDEFESSLNQAKKLKKLIIYTDDDSMQQELFLISLKFVLIGAISLDKIVNLLGLFSDRALLLNLLNYIDLNESVVVIKLSALLDYMFQARQYYVDENAFFTSTINLWNYFNQHSRRNFNSDIEDRINNDKQLAGIYDISQDDVLEASNTMMGINNSLEAIKQDTNKFQTIIDDFRKRLEQLDDLAAEKRQEISHDIEECLQHFLQQKDGILNEISESGSKYLNLMSEKMVNIPVVSGASKPVVIGTGRTEKVNTSAIMLFNDRLSLEKKLDIVKEKMASDLYHYCFLPAIKQLLINKSLYLTGPGGSGKTKVVYQMAELLGLKIYNLGFIADEFTAFKGYMDANGNFVKTPFYTAFKYGGIVFLDEIDNSDSKALIELNKFVNNEGYKPYLFPNDELVYPHPNFRLVAAGNTWGDGADYAYSTREKLDASTIRRFAQIYCGFDNELERNMFDCNDETMFEFAMAFRNALNIREGDDDFSTGDLEDVNIYLKSGIYSIDEIFELKFIRNRRIETLQNIVSNMSKQIFDNSYMNLFEEKVNEMSRTNVKRKNNPR